jgi:hypothetical protein
MHALKTSYTEIPIDGRFLSAERDGGFGADLHAPATPDTILAKGEGEGFMLFPFTCGWGTTHGKILDCTPESRNDMAFEMGENDHAVSKGDIPGDGYGPEMFLIYPDFPYIPAKKPVGNDDRGAGYCIVKTMKNSSRNVIHCIRTAAGIEGIGIGQEREGTTCLHLVHDLPYIDRTDKPVISALAEMEFQRCPVVRCNNIWKAGTVKKALHFEYGTLLIRMCPQAGKIDRTIHDHPLLKEDICG